MRSVNYVKLGSEFGGSSVASSNWGEQIPQSNSYLCQLISERVMTVSINQLLNQTNLKSVKRKPQFLFTLSHHNCCD